jgi:hypothetical protein
MSEAQVQEVLREYAAHEQWLRPQVSAGVAALMDVSLHDGQVQSLEISDRTFTWRILAGDLERGYEWLTIDYVDAEVVGGVEDLAALALPGEEAELLYDELDLLGDGRLVHRVLVWPDGEVWIRFHDAAVRREQADPSARR